ncbi:MAG: MFS transporter [Candidatus Aminicenantales bacterium]|jgi:MFS family permease
MTLLRRVNILNFVRNFTVTSILFLLPLHFVKAGYGGVKIGAIIAVLSVAPLMAAFPTGWINDRFSMAGIVRAALLMVGLIFIVLAWTTNFPVVLAAFFLLGTANNALDVSLQSLYYKDETDIDQNRKYGIYVFWMGFGPVLGIAGGGLLTQVADFRALFLAFAAIMLAILGIVRRFDGPRFHLVGFRDYGRDFFRPKTLLFVFFLFFLGLHWAVEGTVYAPFLQTRFGLNNFQASLFMASELFFLPLSALLIGRRKFDPRANKRLVLAAMALSGAGMILTVTGSVFLSLGFRILHEIGDGVAGALIAVYISRLFEKRSIGGSAALLLAIEILAKMAGAMTLAPLGFRYGLQIPFYIAGGLLVADAIYGAFLFKRLDY